MILQLMMKATLVLLTVGLGALLLRRSSAATRHLARVAGLVGILILPAIVAGVPQWELPLLEPAAVTASGERFDREPMASQWEARSGSRDETPAAGARESDAVLLTAAAPSTALSSVDGELPPAARSTFSTFRPGRKAFAAIWAAGVGLLMLRLLVGWVAMTRMAFDATPLRDTVVLRLTAACCRRLGVGRVPRVLVSSRIRVPMLWGFLSPTLFLPEAAKAWPQGRLRVVLLHELAHLRRRDGLSLVIGKLATAAWWFHPMAWIVDRGARLDCERACDDLVLAAGEKPSEYAAHLLAIARELPRRPAPAGALAFVGASQLEDRVRSILAPRRRRGLGRATVCAVVGALTLALIPVASARLVTRDVHESGESVRPAASQGTASDAGDSDDATVALRRVDRKSGRDEGSKYLLAHGGRYHEGQELFERAFKYHRADDFEDAAPLFVSAAEAGYRPSTSYYNAACGYAQLGDVSRALDTIELAIDAGFDDGSLLLRDSDLDPIRDDAAFRSMLDGLRTDRDTAIGRRAARQYDQVLEAYQDLLDDASADGGEWYRVGSRLLQLREYDTSIAALERAAELLEVNHNAWYNLACAHSLKGDTRAGLDALQRAVEAGFSNEERFLNDTDLDNLRDARRFSEIRDLSETLSLDRFRSRWQIWRDGDYSARRWEPAVEEFTAFTRDNPEMGRGWFNLGWALHHSRRFAEAREAFERQRSVGYRPGNASYNIACTYAMENNVDAALVALERTLELSSVSPRQMLNDDDLESLRDNPRFEDLLDRAYEQLDEDERDDRRYKLRRERKTRARTY